MNYYLKYVLDKRRSMKRTHLDLLPALERCRALSGGGRPGAGGRGGIRLAAAAAAAAAAAGERRRNSSDAASLVSTTAGILHNIVDVKDIHTFTKRRGFCTRFFCKLTRSLTFWLPCSLSTAPTHDQDSLTGERGLRSWWRIWPRLFRSRKLLEEAPWAPE